MVNRLFIVILSVVILLPRSSLAQDDQWTCDGGPNDVLNAAQVAYDASDLDRAYELAQAAEQVCGSGTTVNFASYNQALILRMKIEREVLPTPTPSTRPLTDRSQDALELLELGEQAYNQGRYDEAFAYFEQVLEIARRTGDRAGEKSALNDMGMVSDSQGQYGQALDYYQQALAIARELDDRANEGITLNNIGATYDSQGQYEQALDYYQQALTIAREVGDQVGVARTLNNIGLTYDQQGQYGQALDYFQQSLATARELGVRAGEGITLNNIGLVYHAQGQYGQALDYYQQALAIVREVGDRASEGRTLSNIGLVYSDQAQYQQALDYYQQALPIRREIGDRAGEGVTLNNIGGVYDAQGQYSQALDYYQQALVIAREIGDRAGEGTALNNIGLTYDQQGQYGQALDYHQQALVIAREVGDRAGEGAALHNIGLTYEKQGKYERALDYYQQALVIAREVGDRAGEGVTLNNIGRVYNALRDPIQAIQYYQQAVKVEENLLQAAVLDQAITSLAGENVDLYARLTGLLIQEGDLHTALEYAERGRGILTRDDLRKAIIDFRANLDDQSLLAGEERLRLAVIDAQNLVNALNQDLSASDLDKQNAQAALDDAHSAYEHHLERMQLQGGFLTREIALDVASSAEIQATLPEDTALVLYGVSDSGSYALLVTRDDLRGYTLEATTEDIDHAVRAFAADRRANTAALQDLYNLIFAPIADEITTDHLIISPDGVLNYVPFAALQAPDGSYLIDHYTISMIPSGTALVLLNEREPSGPANSLGLVLAQRDAPGLPRLRNAYSEAETIAATLGVTAVTDATEGDLREGSTGAEVIHISAHAELNRFAPLYSVIYLGEDDSYDGRFEVQEIYELDLSQGTELVILSGCETASGGGGEDFGLLSRAFFAAGTNRVVASLWSVDDQATADLLSAFIEAWAETGSTAKALRFAIQKTRKTYPEPYFWASFVLVGLP